MKKVFLSFITLLLAVLIVMPVVSAKKTTTKKTETKEEVVETPKVKVYIFEAGGCPACEAQINYLQNLDSYKKTFEIVRKELYVDHVDWAKGKDYDLGVQVVEAFNKAGFKDASYQSTPFVVVSDVYASNGYNSSLENVINEVVEKGDKDTVQCIIDGKEDCLPVVEEPNTNTRDAIIIISIFVVLIGGFAGLVVASKK